MHDAWHDDAIEIFEDRVHRFTVLRCVSGQQCTNRTRLRKMRDRALADMLAILRNPIDQRVARATKTIGIKRRARSSIALRFSWNRRFSRNSIHSEQRSPIRYDFTMRIPPVSLMTPRLLLRPHKETDISALTAALNDFDVARRLRNVPHPFTETHARERLAASAKGAIDGLTQTFAVVRLHDQRFIGGVGLAFDESGLVASLGYWIARDEWRHGYARESVQRVVQYAFTERSPSLLRMEAHVHVGNDASRRVLAACAFCEITIEEIYDCGFDEERRAHRYEIDRSRALSS